MKYANIKIILLMALIWTANACSISEQSESNNNTAEKESVVPKDWQRIATSNVEFFNPPDFTERPYRHPTLPNPTYKQYANESIWLNFVILPDCADSNRFAKEQDFRLEKAVIDGKQSDMTTFTGTDMVNEAEGKKYVAMMEIPQIQGNTKCLSMWSYSKSPEDRENVIRIFKSVRFLKEH